MRTIKQFLQDDSGATAVEYALIIGLIAIGMTGAASRVGLSLDDNFGDMATAIDGAEDVSPTVKGGGD